MTDPITDPDIRESQILRLRSIAEELTGAEWPEYPSNITVQADGNVVIEGEVEPEQATPSNQVATRDPFAEWELRRGQLALAKFDKNAWADLQEGKVESLANRVAQLERDVPDFHHPASSPAAERQIPIAGDIAARYGVDRMLDGWFDDTVRSVAVPSDVRIDVDPEPLTQHPTLRGRERRGIAVLIDDHEDSVGTMRFEHIPPAPKSAPPVDTLFWGKAEKPRKPRRFGRKGQRR